MHGRFTWYELCTSDAAGAKKFYPAVTGWGVQPWDASDPANPYEMWTAQGEPFGGLMPLTDEMKARGVPPHWLAYVEVKSASETIAKATGLGAKVAFGPETVPGVGTLAIFKDPQGAMIAILQPDNPSDGYDGNAKLGKPSWHELLTTDYKAALSFYNAVFGWTKVSESDVGGGMMYMEFAANTGKKAVGGMFSPGGQWGNVPPNWLIYTNARNAKDTGAITRGGGKVVNGPMEVPGGSWIVSFTDPQGAAHALHTSPAKAEKPAKKASKPKKKKDKKKDKKKAKKKAKKAAKKAKKAAKKARKKGKKKR